MLTIKNMSKIIMLKNLQKMILKPYTDCAKAISYIIVTARQR